MAITGIRRIFPATRHAVRARPALCLLAGVLLACGDGASGPGSIAPQNPDTEGPDTACEESFDSTFEAIHEVVFVRPGCLAKSCHGDAAAGNLDLRFNVAYENLVAASAQSPLRRIEPTKVNESYLFHKLAAATSPEFVTIDIQGAAMPVGASPIPADYLEGLRLWIESGAPPDGVVGDEFGGSRIADLLQTCLPDPKPVELEPLPPPPADKGIQMILPSHPIDAGGEVEVCFAEYYDFRDQVPDEFETPDRNFFYVNGASSKALPNTHHLTLSYSGFGAEMVDAPEYGRWTCSHGEKAGEECPPLEAGFCGEGRCRSEIRDNVACIGFGPPGGGNGATPGSRVASANGRPGFFAKFRSHGIFYWNSHAFNLSTEDLLHRSWHNYYFTSDTRFEEAGIQDGSQIYIAKGTAPFTKREYCHEWVIESGTELLSLFSHTHKRGERFTMHLKGTGELLYDNPFWDDPIVVKFDPPRLFVEPDEEDRTIVYCATYNNGVTRDGGFDVDLVTRLSRRPPGSSCEPTACAEGRIGEPCAGPLDHATCDTEAGGDGLCDACPITAGVTSDDEMFILLGTAVRPPSDS